MTNQKHLSLKQRMLVAATLFGMFFGAGNLIFPVHLGQLAGRNLIPATAGFILTAVGIPILGVAAIGNTHSDGLQDLAFPCRETIRLFFHLPALLDPLAPALPFHDVPQPPLPPGLPDAWRRLRRTHDTVSLFRSVLQSCALLLPASGQPLHSGLEKSSIRCSCFSWES